MNLGDNVVPMTDEKCILGESGPLDWLSDLDLTNRFYFRPPLRLSSAADLLSISSKYVQI
jgi:hypothetical protein